MEINGAKDILQTSNLTDQEGLQRMLHSKTIDEKAKIGEVSRQFEAVMLRQVLEKSLEPMFEGIMDENGSAFSMARYFWTDSLADEITKGGGLGMSTVLQAQLGKHSNGKSE